MAVTLTKFKGKNALFVWLKLNNFLKNQYLPKYFSQTKLRVWFFFWFFAAAVAHPLENLQFSLLSAIMVETMQKRGILPPFCATWPTPTVQNIAIPDTQKLTYCVSKPIGYLHSHLHANPLKNAPRPLKIDLLINQWLTK